jgi:hypothetical protein
MNTLHTWTADIIRVLSGHTTAMPMKELCRRLWALRNHSALKMPKAFTETVQSALNQHTSQSERWRKNGSRPEDDLFYSPRGKRTGEWAMHRDRAAAWFEANGEGTRGDPVMTLAMNVAREIIRSAIKAKGLDMDEWPASRISQAAKALLDAQGEDGKIITAARRQVEAEREAAMAAFAKSWRRESG